MFTDELIETEDKSYYADWLMRVTGKPRTHWGRLPIDTLKEVCVRLRSKLVFGERKEVAV